MILSCTFEREDHWETRERTTEVTCDIWLDEDLTLRLASDDVEGQREWKIIELLIGSEQFDVRASAFSRRIARGPEPVLPEGALSRAVDRAFAEFVAQEGVGRE